MKKPDPELQPDYDFTCTQCGSVPTIPLSDLCVLHTFDNEEERKEYWEEYIKQYDEKEDSLKEKGIVKK